MAGLAIFIKLIARCRVAIRPWVSFLNITKLSVLFSVVCGMGAYGEEASFKSILDQLISSAHPNLETSRAWHKESKVSNRVVPLAGKISKEKIPTVIIVPGIFAEMIDTPAFSEAFASSNAYRNEIKIKTQGLRLPLTEVFDFESLQKKAKPITEVFEFGDIEVDGQRIANLILLKTELFSLDSLGRMRELSDRFSHRLSTLFEVIGVPEDIIFVGYSRGAAIGLDMLSSALVSTERVNWLSSVNSFISLAGVITGSALADETATPSTPSGNLLRELSIAARDLKPNKEPPEKHILENTQNFAKNALILGRLLKAIGKYALHEIDPANKLRVPSQPEIKRIFLIASDLFKLHEPITEYSANILKLKILLKAVEHGIRELRSLVRVDWWKNNVVPRGINYYSIAASFSDRSEVSNADFGFNFPSIDDKNLYDSYSKIIRLTGDSLNDSQVTVDRATFDLEKLSALNPVYRDSYQMEHLGVLATHHWGIALSKVNESSGVHGEANIFPRTELLKALVLYAR